LLAIKLDEERVFIIYRSNSDTNKFYGVVCTISGESIIMGTVTKLTNTINAKYSISATLLSENKIFITYNSIYTSGGANVNAVICTVDGTSVTVGENTLKSISCSEYSTVCVVALSENKVIVVFEYNNILHGIVFMIDESVIEVGTDINLNLKVSVSKDVISIVRLSEYKVCITYKDINGLLNGVVCNINETDIVVGTNTLLSEKQVTTIKSVLVNEDKVFVAYRDNSSKSLYGVLCTIDEGVIVFEDDVLLSLEDKVTTTYVWQLPIIVKDKIFIIHSYSNELFLCKLACEIKENKIFKKGDTILNTSKIQAISSTLLDENQIFITYVKSSNNNLYAVTESAISEVKGFVSGQIAGVAKTRGTEGQIIKVITPIYNEREES